MANSSPRRSDPTDHREVVRGRRDEKHLCREEQGSGAELRPSGDYGGYFTESQFLTEENKLTGFNVSGRQLPCGSEVNPDEFSLREVKGDVLWSKSRHKVDLLLKASTLEEHHPQRAMEQTSQKKKDPSF